MDTPSLIVQVRLFDRGMLKAFADVTIPTVLGEITLRGFSVMQKPGEHAWVAFPAASYSKDGKSVRKEILEIPRSFRKQLSESVIAEFERAQDHP